MKQYIFYYFSAAILLLASCAKVDIKTSNKRAYYRFNAGLEYIKLPINAYFIYKDSATSATSYVRITESSVEKLTGVDNSYFWSDSFDYDIYQLTLSKIAGTNTETWFSGFADCYNSTGFFGDIIDNSGFHFNDMSNGTTSFYYPFASDTSLQYDLIPVMNFEGKTYRDVHRFTSTNGYNPIDTYYRKTTYYWVKGIGIIKREIRTNNTIQTSLLIQYG